MKYFSTLSHRPVSTNQRTVILRIDPLEDRLTPSAFGPADGAFIVESWSGAYHDVKIQQTNQKIVVSGTSASSPVAVARYDSDGNADNTYGVGGLSTPGGSGAIHKLVLQADGKAVVTAQVLNANGTQLTFGTGRLNANGSLDTSFGIGGWTGVNTGAFQQIPNAVALQSTGKIVIGGWTSPSSISTTVARFTTSGALDNGKGGFGQVGTGNKALGYTVNTFGLQNGLPLGQAIAVQTDNKIVMATASTTTSDGIKLILARYTVNGILDTTFNGIGFTINNSLTLNYLGVTGIALQTDGKIAVEASTNGGDILVVRYNTNGTLDTSFGGGTGYVQLDIDGANTNETGAGLALQPDGKFVVAGSVAYPDVVGSSKNVMVARLNTDGTLDTTFGTAGYKLGVVPPASHDFNAQGMALQSDGSIIVAGYDALQGGDSSNNHPILMRFYGTTSPLNAASTPTINNTQGITLAQAHPLLTEAIARWQSAGFNVSSLGNINLRIADLPGTTLGQAQGNTITLDSNAAGWGWFVDKTPRSDSEFRTHGNQGEQGRMDLLTVLQHEVGHMLGIDHQQSGVMADTLFAGVRRTTNHATNPSSHTSVDMLSVFGQLQSLRHRKHW